MGLRRYRGRGVTDPILLTGPPVYVSIRERVAHRKKMIPETVFVFWFSVQVAAAEFLGEDLLCYDCKSSFKDKFIPDACIANLSGFYEPRRCQRHDRHCMVKVVKVNRVVSTFRRNCVDQCVSGCILKGIGTVTETCTYCCNNHTGCNTGNHGSKLTLGSGSHVQTTLIGCILIILFFNLELT